ncbi:MAG: hypothetical protein ACRDY4_14045 [Acidimicrobiia bacterium]
MARHLGRVAGLAAGVVVASLVLGQVLSGRAGARGQLIALFLLFLAGAFALLAVAVVDSEHGVEQLSATPHWSLRAATRRVIRRMLTAIGRFGRAVLTAIGRLGVAVVMAIGRLARRLAAITYAQSTRVARRSRAGVAGVRESLTPEARRAKWHALRQAGRATLVALGLPPDDEARELPGDGLDAMPTLRRERSPLPEAGHRPRRIELDPFRRAFGPERRRAARTALDRAGHKVVVAVRGTAPRRRAPSMAGWLRRQAVHRR